MSLDYVAYGNLYQTYKGWGHLAAPERFKAEIIEIVNELRKPKEED